MTKKYVILGINCILINGKYCIHRNECSIDKLTKVVRVLKLHGKMPLCITHNKRYYYSVYGLFSEYAKTVYNVRKKWYRVNISKFVKKYSEKNKEKIWIKKTNELFRDNFDLYKNYSLYTTKKYDLLTNEGSMSISIEPSINYLSNVRIEHIEFKKINDFLIAHNVTKKKYIFELTRSERMDNHRSEGGYERYDLHIDNNAYDNECNNCEIKNVCLHCGHISTTVFYQDKKTEYKQCECSSCENWSGCGRDGYDYEIGSGKGNLYICYNCDVYTFADIATSGVLKNIDVKLELIAQIIFSEENNGEKKSPIIKKLFDTYAQKCKIQKIRNMNPNIDACLSFIKNIYENPIQMCCDLNFELNNLLEKKLRAQKIKTIRHSFGDINNNIGLKNKISHLKFTYGKKYKDEFIVDVINYDFFYVQWIIAHNLELNTFREANEYGYERGLKIKKTLKRESMVTIIVRYMFNLPKYPCDKQNCKKHAMYGIEKNLPFRCTQHKANEHIIVIKTSCRGVDGVCPYDCKYGIIAYDNYCVYCFMNLFPTDPRTANIRKKTKELEVVNHVCNVHTGEWYHDAPLWVDFEGGCCVSKRRIDLRQIFQSTLLCIEVDENQHKYYTQADDFVRYNELMCDLTCKYIFIRYNPDSYKVGNKKINTLASDRMKILDEEIKKQIVRINNNENDDLLEIIHLFYDTDADYAIKNDKQCIDVEINVDKKVVKKIIKKPNKTIKKPNKTIKELKIQKNNEE